MVAEDEGVRLTKVLGALDIPTSSWYRKPVPEDERRRPGPPPKTVDPHIAEVVVKMATDNPWYGYQRIAVMCRRLPEAVSDEDAYRVMRQHGLLQKRRRVREPELYQALKLYELLPQRPNDLWQMDVTYLHIPGYGWWYAVTVIDYYSRYLLACHLTNSYSAIEAIHALSLARKEAERLHGPLGQTPFLVTDNGSSFIAKRFWSYIQGQYSHVRIQCWPRMQPEAGRPSSGSTTAGAALPYVSALAVASQRRGEEANGEGDDDGRATASYCTA